MQRMSRLKREMQLLSTEPPPGVSCWQIEGRVNELQARQSALIRDLILTQDQKQILNTDNIPSCV